MMIDNGGLVGNSADTLMHQGNVLIPCWFLSYQETMQGAGRERGREDPGHNSGPCELDLTTQLSEVLHLCLHQYSFSLWVYQGICAAGAEE